MAFMREFSSNPHTAGNPDIMQQSTFPSQAINDTATMPRRLSLRQEVVRLLHRAQPRKSTMALAAAFFQQILCWYPKNRHLQPFSANLL